LLVASHALGDERLHRGPGDQRHRRPVERGVELQPDALTRPFVAEEGDGRRRVGIGRQAENLAALRGEQRSAVFGALRRVVDAGDA